MSILLGSRGLDLLHMNDKLQSLSETRALEPLDTDPDTDIQTFLRNERHNAIISASEDACRQTCIQVQNFFWEQKKADWEQRKQKFMAAFANVNADSLNITSQPQESLMGSLSYSTHAANLSVEEAMYAKLICKHNIEVLNGGVAPSLATALLKEATSMDVQGVLDLWKLVRNITDLQVGLSSDVVLSRSTIRVQTAIVKQARKHLESCYEKHMQSLVFSELERAQLGGVPGLIPLVKAYLSVVLSLQSKPHLEDGNSRGVAVWPLIFYCLRAGGIKAVCSAMEDNNSPAVAEVISALQQIEKSETGRLPVDIEKKIRLSYKRNVKAITDPFKKAVYCLLGHCDPEEDHSEIIVTTDDYLWLKLSMVDLDAGHSKSGKHDTLSLPQLQHKLYRQYGEKHFNAWQQPFLYASVLLLTAQFEAAVEFLSRIEKLRCHAVHVALCLFEGNLLALPSQHNAPLLSSEVGDPEGLQRLNLVQLIKLYVRKLEANSLLEAVHYCFFLRHLPGTRSQSVFGECVSQLVSDTKEFDQLLGNMNADGSRTPGIVDQFKVDVREIAETVAVDSEDRGLHEDAVKLYDLAGNHDGALRLLNQLFGQVAHKKPESTGAGKRDRLLELATSIAKRFRTHGHNASSLAISTLHMLLDLAAFFDVFHQDKHGECLEIMRKLQIIAFDKDEVQSRVASLTSLGPEIKALISQVLLAAMSSTFYIYQRTCSSPKNHNQSLSTSILSISTNLPPASKHLKEQARAIVAFAGMIPIRLNADVNARLVQLEALIN